MFKEVLKRIAKKFNEEKIPYLVIGGQALLIYGEPRFTRDIDIIVGILPKDLDKILELTKEIDLEPLTKDVRKFVEETYVLPLEDSKTKIRVDLIFSFSTFESMAIARGVNKEIEGVIIKFASIEDLIIFKMFSGRGRDVDDVKSLVRLNRKIDIDYIIKWLKEFDRELGTDMEDKFKLISNL